MSVGFRQSTSAWLVVGHLLFGFAGWAALAAQEQQKVCNQDPPVGVYGQTYNVHSNRYGSSARECIEVRGAGFTITDSSISSPARKKPGAYPSIYKGCHWGACTLNSGLPVQVSALKSARSDWSTTLATEGAYNVAYDLWFDSREAVAKRPDRAELMIWLSSRGGVQPFGSKIGQVFLADSTYNVWFGRKHRGRSQYIAYEDAASPGSASNLDIKAFIDDAVRRGFINPGWYLISMEAGFEIWHGGAGLATNSFTATVNNPLGATRLNIWWPRDGAVVSGSQPFQARLQTPDFYEMFWSVDGGELNLMRDSYAGGDHKEARVDFDGWTWRDAGDRYGPFLVTFTAKDREGTVVRQKTIKLYVAK